MNIDQVFDEAKRIGQYAKVGVTVVTNQANEIVSYGTGLLDFRPGAPALEVGKASKPDRLSGVLAYYFSDRLLDLPGSGVPGGFGSTLRQPFSIKATDELGFSIGRGFPVFNYPTVSFTLRSWGGATFQVKMEIRGDLLVGTGAPVGNATDSALYVVSFGSVTRVEPPH